MNSEDSYIIEEDTDFDKNDYLMYDDEQDYLFDFDRQNININGDGIGELLNFKDIDDFFQQSDNYRKLQQSTAYKNFQQSSVDRNFQQNTAYRNTLMNLITIIKDGLKYVGFKDGYGIVINPKNKFIYYGEFNVDISKQTFSPKKEKKYEIKEYLYKNGKPTSNYFTEKKHLFCKNGKAIYSSYIDENFLLNDEYGEERYFQDGFGYKYEGGFRKNLKNGKGIIICKNNEQYCGEFKNDNFNGKGELIKLNGDRYKGEFKNGDFNGKGELIKLNGERYKGEFKNGNFNGKGELIKINGERYKGEFKNGKYEGKGLLIDSSIRYEGEFKDDNFNGKGELMKFNGERYKGYFKKGKYEGNDGELITSDGKRYRGCFKDGDFIGKGLLDYGNGTYTINKYFYDYINNTKDKIKSKKSHLIVLDNIGKKNMLDKISREVNYIDMKNKKNIIEETGRDKYDKHVKILFIEHGSRNIEDTKMENDIVFANNIDDKIIEYLNSFQNNKGIKSFYISSHACKGAYKDSKGNNLKNIVENTVKTTDDCIGFVSFAKSDDVCSKQTVNKNNKEIGFKRIIVSKKDVYNSGYNYCQAYVDLNKDYFFDYYCYLKKDKQVICEKIPNEICYWREYLIDKGLFKDALDTVIKDKPYTFTCEYINKDGKQEKKEITISNFKDIKLLDIIKNEDLYKSLIRQIKNSDQEDEDKECFLKYIEDLKSAEEGVLEDIVIRYYKGEIYCCELVNDSFLERLYIKGSKEYKEDRERKKWTFIDKQIEYKGTLNKNNERKKEVIIKDKGFFLKGEGDIKNEDGDVKIILNGKVEINEKNGSYKKVTYVNNKICDGEVFEKKDKKNRSFKMNFKNYKEEGDGEIVFDNKIKFKGIWEKGYIKSGAYYDENDNKIADFKSKKGDRIKLPRHPNLSLKLFNENIELKEKIKILEEKKTKKQDKSLELKMENNNHFTINGDKKETIINNDNKNIKDKSYKKSNTEQFYINKKQFKNNCCLPFLNTNYYYNSKITKYKKENLERFEKKTDNNMFNLPIISNYKGDLKRTINNDYDTFGLKKCKKEALHKK